MTPLDEIAEERRRLGMDWPVRLWRFGVVFGPISWWIAPWRWRPVSAERRRYALVKSAAIILAEIERCDREAASEMAT